MKIPYGRQDINQEDIDEVIRVLRSQYITQGNTIKEFENAVARLTGSQYAVATNSGTSALHLACLALGLGQDDYLWSSPISFVASVNCALYCQASVDFVDIDPRTLNISIEALEKKLGNARKAMRLPKILVAVHLCGQSCDMQSIHRLSKEYGFRVIEDAAHALGGSYRKRPVGSCDFSDVTIFSFHPVKSITTGEGGMAVTNDAPIAEKMRLLSSHGITRDPRQMTRPPDGPWYYQQLELGFNYRMSDIHAALGLSQLKRLHEFIDKRRSIAQRYSETLSSLPLRLPVSQPDSSSAWHLYVVRMNEPASITRDDLVTNLRNSGIRVNVHYIPIHTQPYFRKMGFEPGQFPYAEEYYEQAISLPIFPRLNDQAQTYVIDKLHEFIAV